MANYERGTPSDDVRVFDGGEDEEDVEGSRLPLLIVVALLFLAAFAAVVWMAYQRGVAQGHSEVPRVIAAAQGPAKVAPTDAGGTPTPYTGLKIYQQPAPSDEDTNNDSAAPDSTPVKPAPIAATPAPPKPTPAPAATPTKPVAMASSPPPATKPAIIPPPPATKPAATAAMVVPPPPAKPAPAKPPADTPVATPTPSAPAGTGGGLLQIGSYKSEAEANAAWSTYRAKHAGLLGGASSDVKQADLGAKGTWFRLRIVTETKASAAALCAKLKADGGDCIPAK